MKKYNNLILLILGLLVFIPVFLIVIFQNIKKPSKDYIKEIKDLSATLEFIDNTPKDLAENISNEAVSNKNLIFLINTSTNLTDDKLKSLKEALVENIKGVDENTKICLITFDKNIVLQSNLVFADDNNKKIFEEIINNLSINRNSCNYDALIYAMNLAIDNESSEIIYVCTNNPTNSTYTYNNIKESLSIINFPIHIISYDTKTEIDVLKEIANLTNGKYTNADENTILETLNNILNN